MLHLHVLVIVSLAGFLVAVACSGSASNTVRQVNSVDETTIPILVEVDLDSVPVVDVSVHSVPLEDVVFDTFDGGFVRLSSAPDDLIETLRDLIRPIYNPGYGEPEALPWLLDADLVIGYLSGRDAYAYPIRVLNTRELVNDEIDGLPILVSFCPLCASGVVYSRELDGETLLFGNTSALYETDLVMFHHQSGSYWFQVLGESIVGKMTGQRLTPLPSMTISWGEWKELHPDTRLLVSDGGTKFSSTFSSDLIGSSYLDALDAGRFSFPVSEGKLDSRLRASELVITVEVGSAFKAYPLARIGVASVNDQVGGQTVVVFSNGAAGSAYLPTVSDEQLTFELVEGRFIDHQTESSWNLAGKAVAGPLEGANLEPVPSRRAFWFSVAGALPGLELYLP